MSDKYIPSPCMKCKRDCYSLHKDRPDWFCCDYCKWANGIDDKEILGCETCPEYDGW